MLKSSHRSLRLPPSRREQLTAPALVLVVAVALAIAVATNLPLNVLYPQLCTEMYETNQGQTTSYRSCMTYDPSLGRYVFSPADKPTPLLRTDPAVDSANRARLAYGGPVFLIVLMAGWGLIAGRRMWRHARGLA